MMQAVAGKLLSGVTVHRMMVSISVAAIPRAFRAALAAATAMSDVAIAASAM
jgi:hypothetical protein